MPTESRSSKTEMVSVPREHELKIRQTPLADLLSGLKTGEIRDCSDREFAVGDTVLLREIDDGREYTGTVARRTITHVRKHYGLPDHLCVLSYGQPAPQPHPEPIAWMVGTAIWWTKEEAERDAQATGLPMVGLGPMTDSSEVERLSAACAANIRARDEAIAEGRRYMRQASALDAVLREARRCVAESATPETGGPTQREAQVILGKIDAALSASVELGAPMCAHCFMSLADSPRRCADCDAVEPSAPVERDEHQEFEQACREAATARGRELDPESIRRRADGSHVNPLTECGWWGWQARAALERKPS